MTPTKRDARVAGLLYLLMVVTGVFDIMVVPSRLFVRGNPAATASNILAHESLFRLDIVVGILSVLAFVFTVLALYHLLHGVHRWAAAIMVVLVLIQVPQAFVSELTHLATLAFLRGPDYLAAFDKPQREALAMLCLHLNDQAGIVSQTFWGLWLFPLAWLVWRSGFIPRVLSGWLVANGLAYLANSVTGLLAPTYLSVISPITFPCLMGEVAFTLWLLVVGVRWPARAEVGEAVQ